MSVFRAMAIQTMMARYMRERGYNPYQTAGVWAQCADTFDTLSWTG